MGIRATDMILSYYIVKKYKLMLVARMVAAASILISVPYTPSLLIFGAIVIDTDGSFFFIWGIKMLEFVWINPNNTDLTL